MSLDLREKLLHKYRFIFEENLIGEIALVGQLRTIDPESILIDVNEPLHYMPLILSGSIRILREDKDDNEILLYYLELGDTCAMTMSCCLSGKKSAIRAVTEQETELIMVPVQKMEDWLVKYKTWRTFVFESYNTRLDEMLDAIDTLAFQNMETRLYKYLEDKAMVTGSGVIDTTHAQIASELNSSRVVISRLMKKLSDSGRIRHFRNKIEVTRFMPK